MDHTTDAVGARLGTARNDEAPTAGTVRGLGDQGNRTLPQYAAAASPRSTRSAPSSIASVVHMSDDCTNPTPEAVRTAWEQFRAATFMLIGDAKDCTLWVWSPGQEFDFVAAGMHLGGVPDVKVDISAGSSRRCSQDHSGDAPDDSPMMGQNALRGWA